MIMSDTQEQSKSSTPAECLSKNTSLVKMDTPNIAWYALPSMLQSFDVET